MVVLIGGALLAAVLGFFLVSAVSTLAHWTAVVAALAGGVALFYRLLETDYLDFESDVVAGLSYGVLSAVAAFAGFRLMEALLSAFGVLLAVIVFVLILGSVVLGPVTVFNLVLALVGEVFDR